MACRNSRVFAPMTLVLIAFMLLQPINLFAQSTLGTFTGTVTDGTGAVIQGATILITNKLTRVGRTVNTDADGDYTAASLDAGAYTITVEARGFNKQQKDGVELLARQIARLDFHLEVGAAASEQIDVTAVSAIATESATIADSKSGREINELALNFRATNNTSPIVVATLAPGVQQDRGGNISIAGGEPYTTSVSIDGISTLNPRFNGPVRDPFHRSKA